MMYSIIGLYAQYCKLKDNVELGGMQGYHLDCLMSEKF